MKGYGYFDRMAPHLILSTEGFTTLASVWHELKGCGNVCIVNLDTGRTVYRRGF